MRRSPGKPLSPGLDARSRRPPTIRKLFVGVLTALVALNYWLATMQWQARAPPERGMGLLQLGHKTRALPEGYVTAVEALRKRIPFKKVHKLSEPLEPSPNTIVTAYFQIPSKHSSERYDRWMEKMLAVNDNLVVFTSHDMVNKIRSFRAHAPSRTVIVEMELIDLPIRSIYNESFWPHQLEIDPEAKIHQGFEVFWIWLSKSWFMEQAIQANYFQSDFYMWSDIGCFRTFAFKRRTVIENPEIVPTGTLLWMAHRQPNPPPVLLWNDKLRQKPHFYHSGSQAAGTADVWRKFHRRFAETLDLFVEHGMFVGEDQCVLQSTCLRFPGMCAYAPFNQVADDNNYFGLRSVLQKNGVIYHLWQPPDPPRSVLA